MFEEFLIKMKKNNKVKNNKVKNNKVINDKTVNTKLNNDTVGNKKLEDNNIILDFQNITKTFLSGTIIANDDISFQVERKTIHAIVGENGSGKSTLMAIVSGLYKQDKGEIKINGKVVDLYQSGAAKKQKIGMVYQHFCLINSFSVIENIVLGQEGDVSKYGVINWHKAIEKFNRITKKYNIELDPKVKAGKLYVGDRQKIEIMKTLWNEKDIIIFDEPTATLSTKEIEHLMVTIRTLKEEGKTIIFISHKLQEVKELADKISILKRGAIIGTFRNDKKISVDFIAEKMIGHLVRLKYPRRNVKTNTVLEVKNLDYSTSKGFKAVDNVSFDVREGEIFGIAGIRGNGQEEILDIISGIKKETKGKVIFNNENILNSKIKKKLTYMSHIPADRMKYGIILDKDLKFNSILTTFNTKKFSKKWVETWNGKTNQWDLKNQIVDEKKISSWTGEIIEKFSVDGARDLSTPIRNLSGGNQQKFVSGREMLKEHKLLIAGHPSRGLDINAINNIYKEMIKNATRKKVTTILYSLEITELIAVCDRIAILYKGRIVDTIDPKIADMRTISNLMVGEINE